MEKLVLIDGNSLINRAFYATKLLTTREGVPTNGVFGFTKLLLKIISDIKPAYMVVAFDLKAPTFRHKMFENYKGTRKPMPDELAAQMPIMKSLLSAMNIRMCEKEGYEADDLIGTLSRKFENRVHSIIITGDRDSYQLVNARTDVYITKTGVSELLKLTEKNFKELIGYEPRQVVDIKALMGDSSDNIPGVAGIGEKTAISLIQQYDNLDNILRMRRKTGPPYRANWNRAGRWRIFRKRSPESTRMRIFL
ncbi:MAG: 5'-3' exonuclease H3TH domain-containing protein [Candidatus Borkfalkia sp.]